MSLHATPEGVSFKTEWLYILTSMQEVMLTASASNIFHCVKEGKSLLLLQAKIGSQGSDPWAIVYMTTNCKYT